VQRRRWEGGFGYDDKKDFNGRARMSMLISSGLQALPHSEDLFSLTKLPNGS